MVENLYHKKKVDFLSVTLSLLIPYTYGMYILMPALFVSDLNLIVLFNIHQITCIDTGIYMTNLPE